MKKQANSYNNKVHTVGIVSSLLIIIALFIVPLGAQIIFGQTVEWGPTFKAMGAAALVFGPVAIIEFLSYLPIIGAGGQYLSFTTGNVMNMKIPAAASGRKIAEVSEGTEEGDAVSMISIAVSSVVTTIIVFVGMVLGSQLLPLLQNPVLTPAFDHIMPAIMGALGIPIIVRNIKTATVPVTLSVILTMTMGYASFMGKQGNMMIIFLVVSLLWAYILYKGKNRGVTKAGAKA